MPGVVRTRVGYCGGKKEHPTYYDIGDHCETIQIDYDPRKISYAELLDVFWNHHSPCAKPFSRQYQCAIFYHDDEQKRIATQSRDNLAPTFDREITTGLVPLAKFWLAEDYHQKYYLQLHADVMQEFQAIYRNSIDFINSTAAARVNSYLARKGTQSNLVAEIETYGLSSTAQRRLIDRVPRNETP